MERVERVFRDREEAGMLLAERLSPYKEDRPLILALPRGGVPVGAHVARALGAPLDIVVVRKLGSPVDPEYGFGAIAPGDVIVVDEGTLHELGLSEDDAERVMKREMEEMDRRMERYREGSWAPDRPYETVIVVDDGLATGVSAEAALESVRLLRRPKKLVFAAPVCARESLARVKRFADDVVCVFSPRSLGAIGAWYEDFAQVSDDEVLGVLEKTNRTS